MGKAMQAQSATATDGHWTDSLVKLGACQEAVEWARQFSTFRQAWLACERADHMLWLVAKMAQRKAKGWPDDAASYAADAYANAAYANAANDRQIARMTKLKELAGIVRGMLTVPEAL